MALHFSNDVTNDAESTHKIDHYVIFASLKSESTWKADKLNTRSPLLISSLPGLASRTHVEWFGKPRDVNQRSQSLTW